MALLAGKRVLLVEDELLIQMDAEQTLHELGAEVVGPACTLEEAAELVSSTEFDLAMMDRNLNGKLSDSLIEDLLSKSTPVLITTGYGSPSVDLPGEPFVLGKPYGADDVASAFRELLTQLNRTGGAA